MILILLLALSIVPSLAFTPYTNQAGTAVQFDITSMNVKPNGANQIFNTANATNVNAENINLVNGSHTATLKVLSDGTLVFTNDITKVFSIATNTGWLGTGTKVFFDDGIFKVPASTVVDTVADLVALTVPSSPANSATIVKGRTSATGRGGGVFAYVSGSTATTNLGTIFAPLSGSGRWFRLYSGSLNATWFGAISGDGLDDSAALQAALNFTSVTNREVYVPSGSYTVQSTITVPHQAKFFTDAKAGAILDIQVNNAPGIQVILNSYVWKIEGFNIVANASYTPTDAIYLIGAREGLISDNYISGDFTRSGICLDFQSWSVEIAGNTIRDALDGILIKSSQVNAPNIHNNIINPCPRAGIRISDYVMGLKIHDNQLERNGYGIWVNGLTNNTQTRVYGMDIVGNYYEGELTNRFIVIDEDNGKSNFVRQVNIQGNTVWCGAQDYAVVLNNPNGSLNATSSGNAWWGLSIAAFSNPSPNDVLVTTDVTAFGATGFDDTAKVRLVDSYEEAGDTAVVNAKTFAARSDATTGYPVFNYAQSSAGEVFLLRYTEQAIDGLAADVWNFDVGGSLGKPLVFSFFRQPTMALGFSATEFYTNIYSLVQTANRVAIWDGGKFLSYSPVTTNELFYLSGVSSSVQTQLNTKQAAFTTGAGVTNVGNVVSGTYVAGANITLTTGSGGQVTIAAASAATVTNDITFPITDTVSTITTGLAKQYWDFTSISTLKSVRVTVGTQSTSGGLRFDVKKNGASIFSVTPTIDVNEITTATAATNSVLSTTAVSTNDRMTFDINEAGLGAKNAQVTLFFTTP